MKNSRQARHIASRIFNTPLLIDPPKLDAILAGIGPRLGIAADYIPVIPEEHDEEEHDDHMVSVDAPGVRVIEISGTLVKRSAWADAESGLLSYERIRSDVQEALDDPACAAIVLDFDSAGGEVGGMFDLAEFLFKARGKKPLIGIANDMAFSAAYALASCCSKLLVTSVGEVGSIGCYMLHCDMSKFDAEMGLKYTYIYSGKQKIDGNPHEPIGDRALAQAQEAVDRIRGMFVELVARNRNISAEDVHKTEAGCFPGEKTLGFLVDQVGTLQDAVILAMEMSGGAAAGSIAQAGATAGHEGPSAEAMDDPLNRLALVASMGTNKWAELKVGGGVLAMRRFGTAEFFHGRSSDSSVADEDRDRIIGILAPYNSLSLDLGGFREIYEEGCFHECMKSDDDLRVLFNHNTDHVLGRRSAGTARFWEEPDGLHYEADLPDTQAARDLKVSMKRGDIKESSAAFYILQQRWEQRSTGRVRIIEKAKLVEGSPASFAAYQDSTATKQGEKQEVLPAAELELLEARLQLLSVG